MTTSHLHLMRPRDPRRTGPEKKQSSQSQLPSGVIMSAVYATVSELRRNLERGLDVDARDKDHGKTALHWACWSNHRPAVAHLLLEHGADINAKAGWQDNTPLHEAARNTNVVMVRFLLDAGADVNARNRAGRTPLEEVTRHMIQEEDPEREILDLFCQYAPEATLASILKLPTDDPLRERTLEWYRENHPEMVMAAYCSQNREAI